MARSDLEFSWTPIPAILAYCYYRLNDLGKGKCSFEYNDFIERFEIKKPRSLNSKVLNYRWLSGEGRGLKKAARVAELVVQYFSDYSDVEITVLADELWKLESASSSIDKIQSMTDLWLSEMPSSKASSYFAMAIKHGTVETKSLLRFASLKSSGHIWTISSDEILACTVLLNLDNIPKIRPFLIEKLENVPNEDFEFRLGQHQELYNSKSKRIKSDPQIFDCFWRMSDKSSLELFMHLSTLLGVKGFDSLIPNFRKIVWALNDLGGEANLSQIYDYFNLNFPESVKIKSWKEVIRKDLQYHSSDMPHFKGGVENDHFYNVEKGQGIWGIRNFQSSQVNPIAAEVQLYAEGRKKLSVHIKRERNGRLIRDVKAKFKLKYGKLSCQACSFCFEDHYTNLGDSFIEGHHIIPVHQVIEERMASHDDIVLLCSNCHRMIHRVDPLPTLDEFKKYLKHHSQERFSKINSSNE